MNSSRIKRNVNKLCTYYAAIFLLLSTTVVLLWQQLDYTADNKHVSPQTESHLGKQAYEYKTKYPITVKDATGQTFTFHTAPKRIVSVCPAQTETMFALGLKNDIVGVCDVDDYPPEVCRIPRVGHIMSPNVEALIRCKPDIVVTSVSMSEEAVKKLRALKICTFQTNATSIEAVIQTIAMYGQMMDRQREAQQIVKRMRQHIQDVTTTARNEKTDKKKVYVEFSPGWTVGKGQFIDDMITMAGAVNVASNVIGWQHISEEHIIAANPDIIIYAKDNDKQNVQSLEKCIRSRTAWQKINAVKKNKIIGIHASLLCRPGPRITEGLKQIARALQRNTNL